MAQDTQAERGVKFLIDECLSHVLVRRLRENGHPDAIHPIHVGMRGFRDDQIVARAFAEDRIVITANGRDYKKLLAAMTVHPGAIIVEALEREGTWRQILAAIAFIEMQPVSSADYMINRIVEVTSGGIIPYELPPQSG